MYSNACNRLFVSNSTEATSYSPRNATVCKYRGCKEFEYSNTLIKEYTGSFGSYGGSGYFMDFSYNKTKNKIILSELIQNEWLDFNTRALCFSWSVHNVWTDRYFITTIFIENPGNSIFSVSFRVQTAYIYKKNDPDSY